MSERWCAVPEYEGLYEVSSEGRLRSLEKLDRLGRTHPHRVLSTPLDSPGRPYARLYGRGKVKKVRIHILVLCAFVGPRPADSEACHRDDDRTNNRLDNLYWGTRSDNLLDRVRNRRDPNASKTACKRGHLFTPENTYPTSNPGGGRACKACCLGRSRARQQGRLFDDSDADYFYNRIQKGIGVRDEH